VTAGKCLGRVRASSGAASAAQPDAPNSITAQLPSNIAAPEDGKCHQDLEVEFEVIVG